MLDLETMGTRPGALLLSIGAVRFDPYAPFDPTAPDETKFERFHVGITMESCTLFDLTIEPGTLQWWMHTDRRSAWEELEMLEKVDLPTALDAFSQWLGQTPFDAIWGNSASFDCGLLLAAYQKVGLDAPWKFWHERCYRTLRSLAPQVAIPQTAGTAHNALADAIREAAHTQAIYRWYRFAR